MSKLAINGAAPVRSRPFPTWPEIDQRDEAAVRDVVRSGDWWMYSYGSDEFAGTVEGTSKVEEFENALARLHNAQYACATASGSAGSRAGVTGIPSTRASATVMFVTSMASTGSTFAPATTSSRSRAGACLRPSTSGLCMIRATSESVPECERGVLQ